MDESTSETDSTICGMVALVRICHNLPWSKNNKGMMAQWGLLVFGLLVCLYYFTLLALFDHGESTLHQRRRRCLRWCMV